MQIAYPFRVDARGRTAVASPDDHLRDLIEQLLFTAPGERVNRPGFGSGLLQQVFAPSGDVVATAVQFSVQGALQQWLGDLIAIDGVVAESVDATLTLTVHYRVKGDAQPRTAVLSRGV